MKKSILLLSVLSVVTLLSACGPSRQDAINYNDAIVEEQERAVTALDQAFNSMKEYQNHEGMDSAFARAEGTLKSVNENLKEMNDFHGNVGYRDTAILLVDHYQSILGKEMKEMKRMYELPDTAYTMSVKEDFTSLQNDVLDRLEKELKLLKKAQWNFALKYDFEELLRNEGYIKSKD